MERTGVPRGKRPRVQVSLDDKERAIARIRNGETKAGISRELGVPESTVRGWVKRAEQRIAREAAEEQGATCLEPVTGSPPLALQSLKLPQKRDLNGHPVLPVVNSAATLPTPLPLPTYSIHQATESQSHFNGWLHIFNAGVLNFTLIATAAYLQARARGTVERYSIWQIITDYVDEAERIVAANGGQYVEPTARQQQPPRPKQPNVFRGNFVAPRVHITAEDDEDTGPEI